MYVNGGLLGFGFLVVSAAAAFLIFWHTFTPSPFACRARRSSVGLWTLFSASLAFCLQRRRVHAFNNGCGIRTGDLGLILLADTSNPALLNDKGGPAPSVLFL